MDIFGNRRRQEITDNSSEIASLDVRLKKLKSDLLILQNSLNLNIQAEIRNLQTQLIDPIVKIDGELKSLLEKYTNLASIDNLQNLEENIANLKK